MKAGYYENKKMETKIDETIDLFKVISEKNRLRILYVLRKEEKCVCEIQELFDLPQNLISYHLKILKESDLIQSKKEGTKIIYSLNPKGLEKLQVLRKFLI